jgi:hypothetical protein
MTFKRKALSALTRTELLEVGRELELGVTTNMRLDELMDVVAGSKSAFPPSTMGGHDVAAVSVIRLLGHGKARTDLGCSSG